MFDHPLASLDDKSEKRAKGLMNDLIKVDKQENTRSLFNDEDIPFNPYSSEYLEDFIDEEIRVNVDGKKLINSIPITKENVITSLEDEERIAGSLINASKKQATGSVFSVKVDISKTGTLGIGI